jgi:hypothetical protein
MPRASWRGFLRLSLVSCPIYLSPATTRTKSIRLHQVWQPALGEEREDDEADRSQKQDTNGTRATPLHDGGGPESEQSDLATRIMLRPHDPGTGEEIKKQDAS